MGPRSRYGTHAPYGRVVHSTTRTWRDANSNFVPDCDLTSTAANGECGALADTNFGKAGLSTTYDPNAVNGWGKRPFDWEFTTSVQQQILPRVSVEVGYFRRWYGNFGVTDNLAVSASDFDTFCITAPVDSRLPDGGGNTICGLYNVNPAKFSVPANNFVTLASNYGKQIEHWNGVDFSVNARLAQRLILQGGVSTGRTSTDNCAVVSAACRSSSPRRPRPCRWTTAMSTRMFLTQRQGAQLLHCCRSGQVQVGGSFQSNPGPAVVANYNAPNSVGDARRSDGRCREGRRTSR